MLEIPDITHLAKLAKNLKIIHTNSYLQSYPYFINFFKEKRTITESDIILWSFFTYGWMPTILKKINADNNQESVLDILNRVKTWYIPDVWELSKIKHYINNSIVWGSKLLHFINPHIFPIWDSKIAAYFWIYGNKINVVDTYKEYIEIMISLSNHVLCDEIQKDLSEKIGYSITKIRSLELVIFSQQRNEP